MSDVEDNNSESVTDMICTLAIMSNENTSNNV